MSRLLSFLPQNPATTKLSQPPKLLVVSQGEGFEFPANATQFDSADCEAAFEGLGSLEDVTCTRGDVGALGEAVFEIGEARLRKKISFFFYFDRHSTICFAVCRTHRDRSVSNDILVPCS